MPRTLTPLMAALLGLAATAQAQQALPEVKIQEAASERDGAAAQGYRPSQVRQLGPLADLPLLDTPFSVNVTTSELLQNLQASKPDDAFRYNPVVQLQGPQSRFFTSVAMRGFSVGSTKRIDGVPSTTTYVNTDLEDKERIEVLTGLSGFLYGSGNVGGTINYVLKRPVYQPLARVTAGITEGSNLRVHGDFGGALDADGRLAYRLNAVAQGGDLRLDGQSLRRGLVSGALDWNLSDRLQLQFDASRSVYHMRGTEPFWDVDPGAAFPAAPDLHRAYGQPFTRTDTTQTQWGARLTWRASEALTVRTGLTQRKSDIDLIAANNLFVTGAPGRYRVQASAWDYPDVQALGGFALVDGKLQTGSLRHKLTAGWYGDHDERTPFLSSAGGWATLTSAPMDIAAPTALTAPAFSIAGPKYIAQRSRYGNWVLGDHVEFNAQWSALVGLTHASITDTSYNAAGATTARYGDSRTTPSLALLFKPREHITLYANYMESLEKGGTAPLTAGGRAVVNAGAVLPPLLSKQAELGIKAALGNMLLTGALFQIDKGLQYTDTTTNPAAPVYVQDGRQVHKGVEFTASGRALPGLTLWGGVTLLDAQVTKQTATPALQGKTPANVAEVQAKLYAEQDIAAVPGLALTGGVLYTGKQQRDALNTQQLPAYTLLDAGLRYAAKVAGKPMVWRLSVANLTDKQYWLNGTYLGRPRTVSLSAQVDL
ncbi:iron complex outermembrane receptor protein [Acidovorax soli]|uniref:Iron complex outermembrane receptor protein n=1 Tax=Acidovorax soli TaxID=592050 RepID=A0A7X0PEH5_9BURK|nr:TonB-dependent siderophore receptor [Acidovorax soli]MBB6560472.1 iron complex outermembrane receptor protein [Acidovorax soli]